MSTTIMDSFVFCIQPKLAKQLTNMSADINLFKSDELFKN